jgi:hypothetical protein
VINKDSGRPAQAIVAAEPGWFVVTLCHGDPPSLAETPIIAWAIDTTFSPFDGSDPGRCISSTWPIIADIRNVRFDNGHWGLKRPDGQYMCGDLCRGDAADCLAELLAGEQPAAKSTASR